MACFCAAARRAADRRNAGGRAALQARVKDQEKIPPRAAGSRAAKRDWVEERPFMAVKRAPQKSSSLRRQAVAQRSGAERAVPARGRLVVARRFNGGKRNRKIGSSLRRRPARSVAERA